MNCLIGLKYGLTGDGGAQERGDERGGDDGPAQHISAARGAAAHDQGTRGGVVLHGGGIARPGKPRRASWRMGGSGRV